MSGTPWMSRLPPAQMPHMLFREVTARRVKRKGLPTASSSLRLAASSLKAR
eukprot:CAMPEP_0170640186 /NCGR_PEP_ID=MMETSP0224-20130122/40074_1 /TAXON_ID=285029 /ORGANISM="Togula jolla, Strain CCCM 725" /LENGTH=50 /DNA_ID=CAMNT_0010970643 /DNA_START=186 /DNA_END=338 /DNA_ORIENTATION=+